MLVSVFLTKFWYPSGVSRSLSNIMELFVKIKRDFASFINCILTYVAGWVWL